MKYSLISLLIFGIKLSVAQINLISGLQGCYPLDCDNAVNNVSANSPLLDGAVFNVTCTAGHTGLANTAYQFGGNSNSYIELPDNNLLKSNTISVSGWFNTSDLQPAYLVYVSNGCTSNFEAFSLNFYAPHGFYLTKGDASCTKVQLIPSVSLNANTWYHVAFYIDNSIMQLYINNVLYSMNHSITWGYSPSKKVILGGTREPSYDQPFNGKIDDLRFYNRQLNASEVNFLYTQNVICHEQGANIGLNENSNNIQVEYLSQNEPNPFNDKTSINYYIPNSVSNAQIDIYDVVGKIIISLPILNKGQSSMEISGINLSNGIYTYRIKADGKILESKRMIKIF